MYNIKNISKLIVEELLNESFESYFEDYIKVSETDYLVEQPKFEVKFLFKLETINEPPNLNIFNKKPFTFYYRYNWTYGYNTPLEILKDNSVWEKSTKTSLLILREFLLKHNTPLVTFSPNGGKTDKVYFHNIFYQELVNNIPNNYKVVVDIINNVIMIINDEYTKFTEQLTIIDDNRLNKKNN